MLALLLSGILVTTQNGSELGREAWRDNGAVVTSDVSVGGVKATLTIDRKKHNLHIDQNGQKIDVPIPDGAAALMNLHWAAYGVLAEQFKDATTPTPFKALLGPDRSIDATVTVVKAAGGAREVTVAFGPVEIHATVDAKGAVTHASVPAHGIEVKPVAANAPIVRRAPPAGVVEEPFVVENHGAKLAGVLWLPAKHDKPVPVVIFIAGSGPVDRDGNAGGILRTDAYRQLAEALARRGVASMRYDKRGVGQSSFPGRIEDMTFDDFIGDTVALVAAARGDHQLSSVYLFGHSEGSLIALGAAGRTKVEGIVSASGAGRPIVDVVREQLAKQLPPEEMKEYDTSVAALKAGQQPQPKSVALQALFQPAQIKFVRGMFFSDPRPLATAFKGPLTVVQGDNDVQISVDRDAKPLAAAHAGAKLVVLKDVGHPLKTDSAKGPDQPSYSDPALPIAPGLVDAVMSTIH